jgi:hypothetical protein
MCIIAAGRIFLQERPIVRRERRFYGALPYLLSKIMAEAPLDAVRNSWCAVGYLSLLYLSASCTFVAQVHMHMYVLSHNMYANHSCNLAHTYAPQIHASFLMTTHNKKVIPNAVIVPRCLSFGDIFRMAAKCNRWIHLWCFGTAHTSVLKCLDHAAQGFAGLFGWVIHDTCKMLGDRSTFVTALSLQALASSALGHLIGACVPSPASVKPHCVCSHATCILHALRSCRRPWRVLPCDIKTRSFEWWCRLGFVCIAIHRAREQCVCQSKVGVIVLVYIQVFFCLQLVWMLWSRQALASGPPLMVVLTVSFWCVHERWSVFAARESPLS